MATLSEIPIKSGFEIRYPDLHLFEIRITNHTFLKHYLDLPVSFSRLPSPFSLRSALENSLPFSSIPYRYLPSFTMTVPTLTVTVQILTVTSIDVSEKELLKDLKKFLE
jgi:hypothetical protein